MTLFDLAAVKKKLIKHSEGGLLVFGTKKAVADQFFIVAIREAMKAIESVPNWRVFTYSVVAQQGPPG